ncbi:hypothetical protein G9A89_019278 [Geosiphon pyriformis]|nr:hypothetical protein G9A89_019278 [Geosiphon pyriformis]
METLQQVCSGFAFGAFELLFNLVMTNFGLTDGYSVHDGLNQEEVFLPLLWCIFYNTLLCEVKRQEAVCGYKLNLHYVVKSGCVDSQDNLTSFLAVSVFVDNTIWVGSSQVAIQHILNVIGEFFRINNISINNNKTVAIPINCRRLDPCGPVLVWFGAVIWHLHNFGSLDVCFFLSNGAVAKNILESHKFRTVHDQLSSIGVFGFSVYIDGSFCGLGSVNMKADAAVFFEDINLSLGMEVTSMVFFTLAELQVIVLALECVLNSSSVCLFSDSQAALNFIHHICWELGSGIKIVNSRLLLNVDWFRLSLVWHLDSHITTGFTSRHSAGSHSYFMKALHYRLPIAIYKCLYDKHYPSVVCLYCGDVKVLDHVFSCAFDAAVWLQLFVDFASAWRVVSGLSHASFLVSQMLFDCLTDLGLVASLCKDFVLVD